MIFNQKSHPFNVDFRLTMISEWQRNTVVDKLVLSCKISAQPHTFGKQICFPNGNVLFLSLFSLCKNWMHNVIWGCAEIISQILTNFETNDPNAWIHAWEVVILRLRWSYCFVEKHLSNQASIFVSNFGALGPVYMEVGDPR